MCRLPTADSIGWHDGGEDKEKRVTGMQRKGREGPDVVHDVIDRIVTQLLSRGSARRPDFTLTQERTRSPAPSTSSPGGQKLNLPEQGLALKTPRQAR